MKSLAGSSLNLFLVKYKKLNCRGNICYTRPREVCLNRPEKIHFLGCPQQLQASVSQSSLAHPRFSVSWSNTRSSIAETGLQQEDNAGDEPIHDAKESESVRVKFELRRECLFGQHFFLVGDDPTFGSWDPLQAIPLNWSDGHIWYVELDICVDKSIKYKFILEQGDGTILWQPGEDRVLETFQTAKTIKVTDNWDNIEPEVVEEEASTGMFEQIIANSDMQLVADNLTVITAYRENDTDKVSRDDEEMSSMPVQMPSSGNLKKTVATKNCEEKGEVEVVTETIESDVNTNKLPLSHSSQEIDENMLSEVKNTENVDYSEGFPVLVPGLIPLPTATNEEPRADKIEESAVVANVSYQSDIIEEVNVPELCGSSHPTQNLEEELAKESRDSQGSSTVAINSNAVQHVENTQAAKDSQVLEPALQNDIVECDFQWGKKTLQKMLMTIGLL